jgi:hypothetical protein
LAVVTEARITTIQTIHQAQAVLAVALDISHTTGLEPLDKVTLAEQVQQFLDMALAVAVALEPLVKMEQLL